MSSHHTGSDQGPAAPSSPSSPSSRNSPQSPPPDPASLHMTQERQPQGFEQSQLTSQQKTSVERQEGEHAGDNDDMLALQPDIHDTRQAILDTDIQGILDIPPDVVGNWVQMKFDQSAALTPCDLPAESSNLTTTNHSDGQPLPTSKHTDKQRSASSSSSSLVSTSPSFMHDLFVELDELKEETCDQDFTDSPKTLKARKKSKDIRWSVPCDRCDTLGLRCYTPADAQRTSKACKPCRDAHTKCMLKGEAVCAPTPSSSNSKTAKFVPGSTPISKKRAKENVPNEPEGHGRQKSTRTNMSRRTAWDRGDGLPRHQALVSDEKCDRSPQKSASPLKRKEQNSLSSSNDEESDEAEDHSTRKAAHGSRSVGPSRASHLNAQVLGLLRDTRTAVVRCQELLSYPGGLLSMEPTLTVLVEELDSLSHTAVPSQQIAGYLRRIKEDCIAARSDILGPDDVKRRAAFLLSQTLLDRCLTMLSTYVDEL